MGKSRNSALDRARPLAGPPAAHLVDVPLVKAG
jgi:hypothetical protein